MAIIAHTPYTEGAACARSNLYICDGHGAVPGRTNRYISDGHGQSTLIEGHHCPADPVLATAYMETLRRNYERQHPPGEDRTKGCVLHEQFYISFPEDEKIPPEIRMKMVQELIGATELRNFAILFTPHDNTDDVHVHLSVCPFSLPDENGRVHKLSMTNAKLNEFRRQMDYICVKYGYSIIENRELWGDRAYKDWFQAIQESGVAKIHPPKEYDLSSFKEDRKRTLRYGEHMRTQAQRQEKLASLAKHINSGYSEEVAEDYFTPPFLMDPRDPTQPLHLRRVGKDGVEFSELEQIAVAQAIWADEAVKALKARGLGDKSLQKKLRDRAGKGMEIKQQLRELDIRTHAELIGHIKECGCDISELRQDIRRQETIQHSMAQLMEAIDLWENQRDPAAYQFLQNVHCSTDAAIADAKRRFSAAEARKQTNQALLEDRCKEYRTLKDMEAYLHPMESVQLLDGFQEELLKREIRCRTTYLDDERAARELRKMGRIIGVKPEKLEELITTAKGEPAPDLWREYKTLMQIMYEEDSAHISELYERMRDCRQEIRTLRRLLRDVPVMGPVSLVFCLVLAVYCGIRESILEEEIETLRWEAENLKEYTRETRRTCREALGNPNRFFAKDAAEESEVTVTKARQRFYNEVIRVTGRLDLPLQVEETRQKAALKTMMQDAASRSEEQASASGKKNAEKQRDRGGER